MRLAFIKALLRMKNGLPGITSHMMEKESL